MDCNAKEGCNYLDGVPVKISAKFIPPRPIPLPFNLDSCLNTDTLEDMYDFALERRVLENHTKHLLQLEEVKSAECNESVKATNHSNVLQPVQPQQVFSADVPQGSHMKINLSDFENDSSSPFDYMELQTINDLEELNNVFQGIHSNNDQSISVTNEVQSNVSKSKSFPESSKEGACSLPSSSSAIPCTQLKQVQDFPSDSYLKLSEVPYISSNAGACVRPKVPSLLRGSKSYSDISSLGQMEDAECERQRSRTPPSTFSYSMNQEEMHVSDKSSNGICDTNLPDPYHELESSAKDFVDSITEMGFSRPQVARTVKHLGTDEKKVVEHLCQIQALEESGYEGLDAEAALHLHDYNRDEAKIFLDLVSQFQDLGFEKSAVKKALVQNKNDWNKTIDALLL